MTRPVPLGAAALRDRLRGPAIMAFRMWAIAGAGAYFKDCVEEPPEWMEMHPTTYRVSKKSARDLMRLLSDIKNWVEGAELEPNPEFYDRIEQQHAWEHAKKDRAFQRALSAIVKADKQAARVRKRPKSVR